MKRMIAAVAVAIMLVGCSTFSSDDENVKVLMIGNSFSVCLMKHLPFVAADRGVDLDLCSLYIGGCSLKQHCENLRSDSKDFKPYKFNRNCRGEVTAAKMNIVEVLKMQKWNIVTIQQASHESWQKDSYHPYGEELIAAIRRLAPTAKIVVQETWSYTPWDKRLAKWGMDQNEMYAKLHEAYEEFASENSLEVIPFGTAVQEWRKRLPVKYTEKSLGGDVVGGRNQKEADQFKRGFSNMWEPNCDVFHLGDKGEYFQALVWAYKLFDVDLSGIEYRPEFVSDSDAELMCEIAAEL